MEQTTFNNRKIAYEVSGTGFPLVLIHGFCEDHQVWEEAMLELENWQIIRIDLPGFGQSETLADSSVEHFAGAIKQVLDVLDIASCIMVGHSMGGYSTLAFAELYPEYLKGFGIFHSHPFADSDEGREKRQKSIDFISKNGHILYVKQLIPKLFPPSFITSKRFLVDRMVFNASRYTSEGIIGGLQAMRDRPDRTDVLRNSSVPVLFVLGEKDDLIPFEKQLEQTHLPQIATVRIFPQLGHMGMVEAPKKTGRAIDKFCHFCLEDSPQ